MVEYSLEPRRLRIAVPGYGHIRLSLITLAFGCVLDANPVLAQVGHKPVLVSAEGLTPIGMLGEFMRE